MATLADKDRILEILRESPDGIPIGEIEKRLGKSYGITSTLLSRLKSEGKTTNPESGVWQIVETAKKEPAKVAEEPGSIMHTSAEIEDTPRVSIPGEFDKFMQIGRSLGIKEDFLKIACDHVFTGDPHNMNFVWDSLNELYLRPDVTRRWYNTWSRVINQPIPPEIAREVSPKTSEAAKGAETKAPTRFTLVGDEIVADSEGEFTFSQARQVLMTRAVQGAAPQLGGERVSEILSALQPYLETQRTTKAEEIEKQAETSVLGLAIKALIESKGGNAQQPFTFADMLTVVDKLDETRRQTVAAMAMSGSRQASPYEELMFTVLKTVVERSLSPPAQNTSPITIAIKGEDGQVGAIPLDAFFRIEDHRRQVRREDEELEDKREMGKTIRGFLDKISKAAASVAGR